MDSVAERRRHLARWGEEAAAAFLRAHGYAILYARYRCPAGEADLVCRDGQTLVFVEVKTRASAAAGEPEEAVTPGKLHRLRQVARHFLAEHRLGGVPCRFDVISVRLGLLRGDGPAIRHLVGVEA